MAESAVVADAAEASLNGPYKMRVMGPPQCTLQQQQQQIQQQLQQHQNHHQHQDQHQNHHLHVQQHDHQQIQIHQLQQQPQVHLPLTTNLIADHEFLVPYPFPASYPGHGIATSIPYQPHIREFMCF
jgi:hypothetical protein